LDGDRVLPRGRHRQQAEHGEAESEPSHGRSSWVGWWVHGTGVRDCSSVPWMVLRTSRPAGSRLSIVPVVVFVRLPARAGASITSVTFNSITPHCRSSFL